MIKKILKFGILFFVSVFLLIYFLRFLVHRGIEAQKKDALDIIQVLDVFKIENGFYPISLEDIDIYSDDFYYSLEGEIYYLYFNGPSVGESIIYSSETQAWNQ